MSDYDLVGRVELKGCGGFGGLRDRKPEINFIEQAIRLSVKDGDVIFFDAEAVNASISRHPWFKEKDIVFVPVFVPVGKTVADCIAVASKETHGSDSVVS